MAALAFLSWKFVETPFRLRKHCPGRTRLWVFSSLLIAVLALLSVALERQWLVTKQRHANVGNIQQVAADKERFFRDSLRRWSDQTRLQSIEQDDLNPLGAAHADHRIDFVLLGDSHAYQLVPLADRLASKAGISGSIISYRATPPLVQWHHNSRDGVEDQQAYMAAQIAHVKRHGVKRVILHAYGSYYQGMSHEFQASFLATVQAFEEAGARVHVLLDTPSYADGLVRSLNREPFFGGLWKGAKTRMSPAKHQLLNARMAAVRNRLPRVTFIDPAEKLLDPGGNHCLASKAGKPLYFDSNHLNQLGVEEV